MLKYKGLTFEKGELINIVIQDGFTGIDEIVELVGCTMIDVPDSQMVINGFPQSVKIPAIQVKNLGVDVIDLVELYPQFLDILKVEITTVDDME